MKGTMNTQLGRIVIDTDVIATYAGSVAVECFGIVGMAAVNMKDGLVKLLKKVCKYKRLCKSEYYFLRVALCHYYIFRLILQILHRL